MTLYLFMIKLTECCPEEAQGLEDLLLLHALYVPWHLTGLCTRVLLQLHISQVPAVVVYLLFDKGQWLPTDFRSAG